MTENFSSYFTLVNCRKLPELLPSTNQNSSEVKKAVIDAKSGNITIGVATVGSVAEDKYPVIFFFKEAHNCFQHFPALKL